MKTYPSFFDPSYPLVTVTVHNYNYGRYLDYCLNSIIEQTYPNIEIIFSDNASQDDSWEIATRFAKAHPGVMTLTQNRINLGPDANMANCMANTRGKYFVNLCSDDALDKDFVTCCVDALEKHPSAALAMTHRCIIDQSNARREEAPFYNGSFLIPGPEQAAVYMMAAVNPSISQVMYNLKMATSASGTPGLGSEWYAARLMDFRICCKHDFIYIDKPLLLNRLHDNNDAITVKNNLLDVIAPYLLQHQFTKIAAVSNYTHITERLPDSIKKLGQLCTRYCFQAIIENNEQLALQYYHLGLALSPQLAEDPVFKQLSQYFTAPQDTRRTILENLSQKDNFSTRTVSYPPPAGSTPFVPNINLHD